MLRSSLRLLAVVAVAVGCSQFQQRDELMPVRLATHNYAFRNRHYYGDTLFNGFDYGHATAYEALIKRKEDVAYIEGELFDYIMGVNDDPPRLQPSEEAIAPNFTKAYWPVMNVFDWAHGLHRLLNDILADPDITDKHAAIEDATDYYLRHKHALHPRWKRMDILMDGQPYSKEFRTRYPKWNGIIWAYHWFQNGVYEPLILGRTESEKAIGVAAAAALFQCSRHAPPTKFPPHMPMSWEAAPTFAKQHPRAAAIFDNLHMLHDIVGDVLVSDKVQDKRGELVRMIALLQDSTSYIDEVGRGMGPSMAGMKHDAPKKDGDAGMAKDPDSPMKHDEHGGMDHGGGAAPTGEAAMPHPVPAPPAPTKDFAGGPGGSCADGLKSIPAAYIPVH